MLKMGFEVNYAYEAEANWPIANNSCFIAWRKLSTQGQPAYVGTCDIHIKGVVTW